MKNNENFEEKMIKFYNSFTEYLTNYIIPDVIAFYIFNAFHKNFLSKNSLQTHINSAIDVFNIKCNKEKFIPEIEKTLLIKYNLIIKNTNPLTLKFNK